MEDYSSYYGYDREPVWVGLKRGHERSEGKLDAAVMEKRQRCDDKSEQPRWKHVAAYEPSAGAKRGYDRFEDEMDAEIEAEAGHKRYKCNYWEDPACANFLQFRGGREAKHAAERNHTYRFIKEIDEWLASMAARKDVMH